NYQLEINALFYSENEVKSVAKPIYVEGYYNKPALSKTSPLNIPDYDYGAATSATNGPRLMGELTMITLPDNTFIYGVTEAYPVSFGFSVAKLERYVSEFTITDTLPTYISLDENGNEVERLAVFEPELNPNWVLGEDGKTVTQHKQILRTLYPSSNFDPLVLKFPGLKSGYNLVNNAEVVLVPDDKGSKEGDMIISDDISIYAAYYNPIKYEGDPRFDKEHAKLPRFDGITSYFYDTPEDRDKIIPYFLRVSSMASQSDLVNVRITDYDLDERLYYYGVSFPKNVVNIPLTIVAYKQLGEKMDPLNDTILQSDEIIMTQGDGVIFNEEIAKSIDYIQIILPENHKVFSALEFHVDTKLRVPEDSVYTSDPLSNKNIFRNYAVMSGNLYHKGTTVNASIRTDPLLDENGTIISRYTEAWDNLPGNYIWGENAQVNVRGYEAYMGVSKTQTYATNRNVYPGEEGDYILSLDPRTEKNKIGSGRGIIEEELYNFKMVDLLPKGVVPIEIIPTDKFKSSMGAKYEIVDNYNNTGRLAIVF
ncbi:MAG: hypothetical protein GXY89_05715, partial [Tissierellia bacterium]|nr:hypothetical protein [Tissierellia bacterium]